MRILAIMIGGIIGSITVHFFFLTTWQFWVIVVPICAVVGTVARIAENKEED